MALGLAFEFDPRKAAANLKKHDVSFAEAMTVFDDPFAQTFPDEFHRAKRTDGLRLDCRHGGDLYSSRIWSRRGRFA
jgi:hypothetical protein